MQVVCRSEPNSPKKIAEWPQDRLIEPVHQVCHSRRWTDLTYRFLRTYPASHRNLPVAMPLDVTTGPANRVAWTAEIGLSALMSRSAFAGWGSTHLLHLRRPGTQATVKGSWMTKAHPHHPIASALNCWALHTRAGRSRSGGIWRGSRRAHVALKGINPDGSPDLRHCIIIGGGPAGLTAALYLAGSLPSVTVFDAGQGSFA